MQLNIRKVFLMFCTLSVCVTVISDNSRGHVCMGHTGNGLCVFSPVRVSQVDACVSLRAYQALNGLLDLL